MSPGEVHLSSGALLDYWLGDTSPAETDAAVKLRQRINDLPLEKGQTLGQAAEHSRRIGDAIDSAVAQA